MGRANGSEVCTALSQPRHTVKLLLQGWSRTQAPGHFALHTWQVYRWFKITWRNPDVHHRHYKSLPLDSVPSWFNACETIV